MTSVTLGAALVALVAHVEGEARSRVEALRAALEGRS
jgi:hypothetical protein